MFTLINVFLILQARMLFFSFFLFVFFNASSLNSGFPCNKQQYSSNRGIGYLSPRLMMCAPKDASNMIDHSCV